MGGFLLGDVELAEVDAGLDQENSSPRQAAAVFRVGRSDNSDGY